jgi:hypothetical protein
MATRATSLAEARSHNVPPDVFLRHYREIRDLKDAQADAAAAVARAKKSAKGAGIDLDALKMLEKLASLDTDEAEMQLQHLQIYAKWIDLPVGMQGDFFGQPEAVSAEAAQEQREWAAGDEGLQAGRAGHERDTNPHTAGSAEHVAWDKAWAKGNKTWMTGQKPSLSAGRCVAVECRRGRASRRDTRSGSGKQIASEMGPKTGNGAATPARKRGRPKGGEQAAIL